MSSSGRTTGSEEALIDAIETTPIIDNHAHPLLKLEHIDKFPLLAIATEANGDALESSRTSMAHIRAVNQLSRLLACEPTWDAVAAAIKAKRQGEDQKAWVQRCMSGIEAVLVDDGLGDPDQAESYRYFDQFTSSKSKRIVRIEYEATLMIQAALATEASVDTFRKEVVSQFDSMVRSCIEDIEVVGFKSVICYRTGLDIRPKEDGKAQALKGFENIWESKVRTANYRFERLSDRGLTEFFVHRLAQLIEDTDTSWKKPIQFHTGLGDNDITLTTSNPAYLQPFIREHPHVPIVLLHASYPFTREAGYLAAMYANVYADIGEVFPFVNRDGQLNIIRQILELCPVSKILWSTDGHWFPETYLLAVEQMRVALKSVLCEFTSAGDVNYTQAIQLVEDVLFNNSNKLYDLGLVLHRQKTLSDPQTPREGLLNAIRKTGIKSSDVQFLRISWIDMASTPRARAFPMRRVWSLLEDNKPVTFNVVSGALGLLQNDFPIEGLEPVGERKVVPDWGTLHPGPRKGHVVARAVFQEQDGSPVNTCPRTTLKRILNKASEKGLEFMLGFEIELVLLRRTQDGFEAVEADGHAWCVSRVMDSDAAAVLEEAILQLAQAGIFVDVFHPESAQGGYEIVLPKTAALEAVDTLLFAREVISACALSKGYKMTLHPKPFATQGGTAAHVHMSISTPEGDKPHIYEPFYAGILKHLRALVAFTCSSKSSYDRIQDGCWAGGTWITWGTQNRETPLRKVAGSHWEVKSMDGTANPYLALAALIGAGVHGVVTGEKLDLGDCKMKDPARLSEEEREALRITERLPRALSEAIEALKDDKVMEKVMGEELVDLYVRVKETELGFQEKMSEEERWRWMVERF